MLADVHRSSIEAVTEDPQLAVQLPGLAYSPVGG